ncbi:MAG: hypothetical protein IPM93_23175 [Candidatus Obscuribacter sp.]|nr:hypothetical protein [Candidatus Obscuribacter sp.]
MIKILFLVSGQGGTLKFLHNYSRHFDNDIEIIGVIADRECGAVDYARENGLTSSIVQYSRLNPIALHQALHQVEPDLIVTNIHKILDVGCLLIHPGRFINLHYSLLPAYSGLIGMATLEEARKQQVRFIGATCHFVTEQVDAGQIISQACFPVSWDESTDLLRQIIYRSACLCMLNAIYSATRLSGEADYAGSALQNVLGKPVSFSPKLGFHPCTLDEGFWTDFALQKTEA